MPVYPLDPVKLSPGLAAVVALNPSGGPQVPNEIAVYNESPWPLSVGVGGNAYTVPAWVASAIPVTVQKVTLTPQAIATEAAYPSAVALVDVATAGDVIPGTFPAPLVRAQSTLPSICKLSADVEAGAYTFKVDTPGSLTPGGYVYFQGTAPTGNTTLPSIPYPIGSIVLNEDGTGTVTLSVETGIGAAYPAGTYVVNVPIQVAAQATPVAPDSLSALDGGSDTTAVNVTIPAGNTVRDGLVPVIDEAIFTAIEYTAGQNYNVSVVETPGVGSPKTRWQAWFRIVSTQTGYLALPGAKGIRAQNTANPLVVGFSAKVSTTWQAVSVAFHYE